MLALATLLAAATAPPQPAPPIVRLPPPPAIAAPDAPRVIGMPAQRMLPLQQQRPPATLPRATLAPGGPSRDQVLAAVRAEWPTYDTRHQGRLGPLEFGTWVMRANGAEVQAPGGRRDAAGVKPVTAMNVTASAFAKADANHDGGVTPEEMAAFLTAR